MIKVLIMFFLHCNRQITPWKHFTYCLFCSQYATVDPRQRRASDGVLCVVKETSSETAPSRGHRSPLLSYKTEPGAGKFYFKMHIYK